MFALLVQRLGIWQPASRLLAQQTYYQLFQVVSYISLAQPDKMTTLLQRINKVATAYKLQTRLADK